MGRTICDLMSRNGGGFHKTARLLNVFAAIAAFLRNGLRGQNTAQRHAVCVTGKEELSVPVKVRNLTVSHAHTFYANGILTHNCDALGIVGQLIDQMTAGRKPKKKEIAEVDDYAPRNSHDDRGNFKVM
jgi:hypothetical protein